MAFRLVRVEKYLELLKVDAAHYRKEVPLVPHTPLDNFREGYLKALDAVIKDLGAALE